MDFTEFDKAIGQALFEARVVKRITQTMMAEQISKRLIAGGRKKGISQQAYALYEKGERSMPTDTFKAACNVLGLEWAKVFNNACEEFKEKENGEH